MASILSHRMPQRPMPATIAPLIAEQYGISASLALQVAGGALSRTIDALALARQYKLISIDTTDARKRGLIQ